MYNDARVITTLFVLLMICGILNLFSLFDDGEVSAQNQDAIIAQKVLIIEKAKNSDNPTVIAAGKEAEKELQNIQKNNKPLHIPLFDNNENITIGENSLSVTGLVLSCLVVSTMTIIIGVFFYIRD